MIIIHTCFTLPVILITSGEVDFVASKFETFKAKAVKPWNNNNPYTIKDCCVMNEAKKSFSP